MRRLIQKYIQTPQRFLAFAFLFLLPFHTILILNEQFVHGYKWEYGTTGYYGIEILGWIYIGSVLVQLMRRIRPTRIEFHWTKYGLFVVWLLIFLLYSFASSLWAIDSSIALQQSTRFMLGVLVFLSLPMVLRREEIVTALAIGSILPVSIGIYQFISQTLPGSVLLGISGRDVIAPGVSVVQFGDERWLRAYGTFAHPNIFGGYLLLTLIVLVLIKKKISTYWYVLISLLAVTLVFTMSRSAWVSFGVCMLLQLLYTKTLTKATLVAIASMGIAAVLVYPVTLTRVTGTSAHEYWSFEERSAIQDMSLDMIEEHLLLGTGAGNMTRALIERDDTKFGYAYQPVHNVFLLLFVEYGLAGILLIGILLYTGVRMFWAHTDAIYVLIFLPILWFDHYMLTSLHGMFLLGIGLSMLVLSESKSSHRYQKIRVDEV